MPSNHFSLPPAAIPEDRHFVYQRCHFICSAKVAGDGRYQPSILYQYGLNGLEQMMLPIDSGPYGSAVEAHRHAERQAIRWVHDRAEDEKGRF